MENSDTLKHNDMSLIEMGFPASAIAALKRISELNDETYLMNKIYEEINHLHKMNRLTVECSVKEVYDLLAA